MALWRVRATVLDRPGYLSVLTASLALKSINILSVQVLATEQGAVDDFLIEAPAHLTSDDIVAAVERGRGTEPWVARADTRRLTDEPTRVLALAARAVANPGNLGEVVEALLGPCSVRLVPGPATPPDWEPTQMRLPHPDGGILVVHRSAPDFTPTEFARVEALLSLVARACGTRAASPN